MTKTAKAILTACGIGAAGYAVYRSRKPKRASDIWNFCAPVYNTFMRMNHALYEEMYRRIRAAIQGKRTRQLPVLPAMDQLSARSFAGTNAVERKKHWVFSSIRPFLLFCNAPFCKKSLRNSLKSIGIDWIKGTASIG